jgi:hypothetical protein
LGALLSLPFTVIHFLGLQLIGLLIAPWAVSIISRERFFLFLLTLPVLASLSFESRRDEKKINKIDFSSVKNIVAFILPTIFAVVIFLKSLNKYPNGWAFWALGGDSRNFLIHTINTTNSNGLTESMLARGPMFPSSLIALLNPYFIEGSNHESYFQTIALLEFFFLSLSSILLAIFTKQLLAKLNITNSSLVLVASIVPFSGLYSGVLQRDGFFGVSTLLPIVISLLILLLEVLDSNESTKKRLFIYFSGALILPVLILLTWTPFIVFAILFVFMGFRALFFEIIKYKKISALVVSINILLLCYCLNPLINSISADSQLTARGAITPPGISLFLLVLMYFVYNIKTAINENSKNHEVNGMWIVFSLSGLVNLFLIGIQPFEAKWNYYPSKYGWIWLVIAFPLVISTFGNNLPRLFEKFDQAVIRRSVKKGIVFSRKSVNVITFSFSLVLFHILQPPVASPWFQPWFNGLAKGQFGAYSQVLNGWASPSPEALARLHFIEEPNRQSVFFKYYINPSDDRMSNFLLVLHSLNLDGSMKPIGDKLSSYAYFADPSDFKAICELVDGSQGELKILTKSRSFISDFKSECKLDLDDLEVLIEN